MSLVTLPTNAVIRAIPGATPVTTPSVTVATLLFEEAQEKVTPVITLPSISLASAVRVALWPTTIVPAASGKVAEEKVIEATSGVDSSEPLPPPHPIMNAMSKIGTMSFGRGDRWGRIGKGTCWSVGVHASIHRRRRKRRSKRNLIVYTMFKSEGDR